MHLKVNYLLKPLRAFKCCAYLHRYSNKTKRRNLSFLLAFFLNLLHTICSEIIFLSIIYQDLNRESLTSILWIINRKKSKIIPEIFKRKIVQNN